MKNKYSILIIVLGLSKMNEVEFYYEPENYGKTKHINLKVSPGIPSVTYVYGLEELYKIEIDYKYNETINSYTDK